MRRLLLGGLAAFALAVYMLNASWLAPKPESPEVRLIAHRGVHHTFHRSDLTGEACTAERIFPPEHELFENTIASMQAAFAAGAYIVELDVHPTTDDRFAVFHDWTLDCRTDGTGETRSHDVAYLKSLDIGHGYTADGGRTFPLRGKGVGLMPMLDEVLATIPEGRFLIDFKSNEEREGAMLADLIAENPEWHGAVWGVHGGHAPASAATARVPDLNMLSRRGLVRCMTRYAAIGWTGYVPQACRDTFIMVPVNVAPFLWGWPDRFGQRMRSAGSEIILLGPYERSDPGAAGIDDEDALSRVPESLDGYVWTNRIELIGPAFSQ